MSLPPDKDPYRVLFGACNDLMLLVRSMPQPVIARVDGVATAAGCQLVGATFRSLLSLLALSSPCLCISLLPLSALSCPVIWYNIVMLTYLIIRATSRSSHAW